MMMVWFGQEQIMDFTVIRIIFGEFLQLKTQALPNNHVWSIVIDGQNKKWIGTKNGLATITDDGCLLFDKKNTPLKSNVIKSIVCDDYDRVWVSTEREIVSFDGEDWKKHKLKNKKSLIISLFVDAFDNKWISTSKNVVVLQY